ncbi:AbiV family abortive infection protein [Streptomyces sp. R44]|uniref:AbiV family abortive infection protein n=1 Tax=Streptomyces sp. R44 TaxID=3238633 RepID=A0AB39T203_9ACTN
MTTLPSDPEMADRILIDIGREAFKHARDLLHAARLILDAGIWSVAYANAALALEEIGKAVLCSAILPMPPAQRQAEVDGFPDRFTSHEVKSFSALLVLRIVEGGATEGGDGPRAPRCARAATACLRATTPPGTGGQGAAAAAMRRRPVWSLRVGTASVPVSP